VHFYGAGCSNSERCAIVERSIQKVLIGSKVNVEHDLLASARATCQRESGIACILGTGSNSCAFDGKNIIDNIPSMGFILGDEGSGASLGRSLLSAWFYRELPADLEKRFIERFQVTQKEIIDKVYSEPNSNRYVASFAVFCAENRDHSFVQNLIKKNFELFVSRMVLKYETAPALPIHFVGSVAEGFQSELNEVLENHDLTMGRIIKSPIDELIKFHCDGI
jgi:glucosamine kinase